MGIIFIKRNKGSDNLNYFNDVVNVNKRAVEESFKILKKNPAAILLPLIFSILFSIAGRFNYAFYRLGFIGGFIVPIIYSLLLSVLYDLLSNLIYYNRLSFKHLESSMKNYFGPIYSVYFILIILGYVVPAIGNFSIQLIIWVAVYIIFNPMSETIYIKEQSYTAAFSYSLDFMKNNFLQWLIPLILSFAGIYFFGGWQFISDNATLNIPIGVPFGGFGSSYIIKFLIFELLAGIYIIYRACLFRILSTSTIRKRQYMGGF